MKKGIVLSLIGIVIVSIGFIIIVNKNTKKVIMQDGTILALTLDGESITAFPSSANYRAEINCTNGSGKVLPEDGTWKFSVDNIKGNIKCNINFYTRTANDKLTSKVQSATGIVNEGTAGYRYEGQNPNNYIWFNNEMWRIIGLIPTKVATSGTTNLVKIIRKDSLGEITYDAKNSFTGAWGSNTLYTLLNNYYYGKKDGTNTAYCYGYNWNGTMIPTKCDYKVNGISSDSTDYYGKMVKNVYWNTGASSNEATVSTVYTKEKSKQTVQARIGLMNASDFGYAASATYHSTNLSAYNTVAITSSNWLFSQGEEWTITHSSVDTTDALPVYNDGSIYDNWARLDYDYRPVVYLNENVYVISGTGTEADPYIIGM